MKLSNSLQPSCLCFLLIAFLEFMSAFGNSDTYIIHIDSSAIPKAFSSHQNWYLSMLSSASDRPLQGFATSSSSKLLYSYTNAINGFSAVLSPTELEAVKHSPGYVSSTRDTMVEMDTTSSFRFLGLNPNGGAWPVSGYGEDVIIGMVDTGVWPESKSFDDDGMSDVPSRWRGECQSGFDFNSSTCNKKLVGARYFNKGLLARNPNMTVSMNSARDVDGHGTHTSSTAAGSYVDGANYFGYATGTARGMAPRARLAMYKALWQEGSYVSDIVAAIDGAIADSVDVLSISLGVNGAPLHGDPVAIATFAAMEKGIFVSTSAGNLGPDLWSLHNGIPWVLTVAAGTIDRSFLGTIALGNGVSATGLSLYHGDFASTESPMVFLDGCNDNSAFKSMEGKIVVCLDTQDTLSQQVYLAENAKLAGGVFITSDDDVSSYIKASFPAIFLTPEQGQSVLEYIKTDAKARATFKFQQTVTGTKPAPKLASYSARGPSMSCPHVLKPDIMAPGDLILASWPWNKRITSDASGKLLHSFNILSGTSMSCPHASGIAALIKGTHPNWSPAAIRSALMTTSYIIDNSGSVIKDVGSKDKPANPFGMGAGHVDPDRALDPGLVYDAEKEDYIKLICAMNFTSSQIQSITRSNSYSCSNASLDMNYPSFIAFFDGKTNDSVTKVFDRVVTNVGNSKSIYTARLTGLGGLKVTVRPERLEFSKKYEKRGFRLRVEGSDRMKESMVYGSLTWVESKGRHHVRSPIVATNMDGSIDQ
ncbi:subtilisin-like protease SBT3 [Andrographis paniculata]|uniref:subtilisin-like protease SBT3 n=1 Tax=Andrographis paniculata TaxID=175694 RepID=UPI0021E9687D|nr:subtilisin-like protease SBT3 [Andrographis paniculata]